MSFFSQKKKPSPSKSAPTQFGRKQLLLQPQSQEKQQSQPDYPWSAHVPPSRSTLSPLPRDSHSLSTTATAAGELFLFGGYVQSSESASNDLYTFSTRDFSTTLLKTSGQAPNPRYGHGAAFASTTLLIWGGVTNHSDRNAENRCDDESLYLLNFGMSDFLMLRHLPADESLFHSSIAGVDPHRDQRSRTQLS